MSVYTNRVFDSVASDIVHWETSPDPDPTGVSYPGPGVFGVDTSDYTVSAVIVVGGGNFSYKEIAPGESVIIPERQQMIVSGGFTNNGELILNGELKLIPSSW